MVLTTGALHSRHLIFASRTARGYRAIDGTVVKTVDERLVCVDCGRCIRDGPETPSDGR